MAAIGPDAAAVVPAAREILRNGDVHFPFRQQSDFQYLTGFGEPDALLVLTPGNVNGESTLFVRPRDIASEQWTGERLGHDRACEVLGVDRALPLSALAGSIESLLSERTTIHVDADTGALLDDSVRSFIDGTSHAKSSFEVCELKDVLHELRLIKTPFELECMQVAADITVTGHIQAMAQSKPGIYEYQLEAVLIESFTRAGARSVAYPSIVGSGGNACVMHYIRNDRQVQDGDLVLIDAGCEYQCYAADVTRTFPVNGRFSARQRDLYEVVLAAQGAAIAAVEPGVSFREPHNASIKALVEGLIDLRILKSSVDEVLDTQSHRRFTVHSCSHFLGLDVHDAGRSKHEENWRALKPGMVLTIEPGLYIPDSDAMHDVADEWKGLGIRVEDDVVVEAEGGRVLTQDAPKSVEDIEALMNG